jgi:raffinose/stachyose/melibiose transport system substrate-binding protein
MNTRKTITFLVTLLTLTSMILSGCASATPTAATTKAATEAPATEAPTVAPTEAPPAEPVTLVYWSMWNEDEPMGQVMKAAIDAFQADYPNVTIEVTWQGRNVRKLFTAAIDSGTAIDLIDNDTGRIALTWGDKYILGLNEYVTQPSLDSDGKSVADTIFPLISNQYKTKDSNNIASVPFNPYINLWFYNKAEFEKAGITQAPTTVEEWMDTNEKLKAAGIKGAFTYDPDSYTDVMAGDSAQRYVGCEAFNAALTDKTGEAWKGEGFVQWAKDMQAFSAYALPGTSANLYPAGQQAFALGDAAMTYNGTWLPSEVAETAGPDFQWGAFSWPTSANGVGTINDYDMGSQGMAITKVSQHPDVAFEFIKYVVSVKIQKKVVDVGYASSLVDLPWSGPIADAYPLMKNAKSAFGWACGGWDTGDFFANDLLPAFTDLITGKTTADKFLSTMSEKAKTDIK